MQALPRACPVALLTAILATPASSQHLPTSSDLLERIRVHMRSYVERLPDYTCRVTLERSHRPSVRARFVLDDRLRLDVAYSGANELYAWPGDDRFERSIEDLLPDYGMISDGSYALHVRKLFLTNDAAFDPPVETTCDGRPCVQLDFRVPASRSGYSLGTSSGTAPAALAGSVWFDRASLDPRRLLVRIDEPPRTVRIASTREETVYAPVPFGDREAVLPQSSELLLTDRNGSQSLNRSTFQECHQFIGSSTITYGAQAAPTPEPAVRRATLPAGMELEGVLDAIGPDLAIGDLVTATVVRGPAGGRITCRVTRLRPIALVLLKLEWPGNIAAPSVRLRHAPDKLSKGAHLLWRVE